ncbi:MAG: hypothetical protein GY758_08785 [Fuerstiella sp.]|nr:hypothetical protein [Fuerstiella sp.]
MPRLVPFRCHRLHGKKMFGNRFTKTNACHLRNVCDVAKATSGTDFVHSDYALEVARVGEVVARSMDHIGGKKDPDLAGTAAISGSCRDLMMLF